MTFCLPVLYSIFPVTYDIHLSVVAGIEMYLHKTSVGCDFYSVFITKTLMQNTPKGACCNRNNEQVQVQTMACFINLKNMPHSSLCHNGNNYLI